jgi:hypothetical protein
MSFEKTSAQFFDNMYANNNDPWNFEKSEYELNRYQIIFNALAHKKYNNVFEPGCSIGVLTEKLATICHSVHASDVSLQATLLAKRRCEHLSNVFIKCERVQDALPAKNTDLLILSEIGYYFIESDLHCLIKRLVACSGSPLTILASHWLGNSADHLLSADKVHAIINSHPQFVLEDQERNFHFRLDRWIKN